MNIDQRAPVKDFAKEIELKRQEALQRLSKIPIAILLWGPSEDKNTEIAKLRVKLKETLEDLGHVVTFSEDLYDEESQFSLRAQQFVQIEVYDIIISIPETEGSIAEIHDFARMPALSNKIIAFLNTEWNDGYSNKTLIEAQTHFSCKVIPYTSDCITVCIIDECIKRIAALQEAYYIFGRRINA